MKFSTALSLCLAPAVMARNVYERDHPEASSESKGSESKGSLAAVEAAAAAAGLALGSLGQIIVIWVNAGGGSATTTVNKVSTVTQTVTAGGAAATTVANGAAASVTTGAATTTVATGAGATHSVTVGGPKGLAYEPNTIKAAVGDMVIFTFLSQNHTVSQSAFSTPCELLAGGMDSGFQPNVNNTVEPAPQVAMQVMVDTPLWFYCRQKGHCGKGMVFSINPTADKSHAQFAQLAIAQNGTGTDSGITGGTPSAVAGTTTTAATPAAVSTTAAAAASGTAAAGVGLTYGTGSVNTDGSCSCAVVCNSNSFPVVQAQGIGAFGGWGGAVPMSALAAFR